MVVFISTAIALVLVVNAKRAAPSVRCRMSTECVGERVLRREVRELKLRRWLAFVVEREVCERGKG